LITLQHTSVLGAKLPTKAFFTRVRQVMPDSPAKRLRTRKFDWSLIPLTAPKLEEGLMQSLSWSTVFGATGYVLESSLDASFSKPTKVYEGSETAWTDTNLSIVDMYYRVKAIGQLRQPSAWSNAVTITKHVGLIRPPLKLTTLTAPKLTKDLLSTLSWNTVTGAIMYLVERSYDGKMFANAKEVYRGDKTSFFPWLVLGLGLGEVRTNVRACYRVKAVGRLFALDSPWSNVVTTEPIRSLQAPTLTAWRDELSWTEVFGANGYVLESSVGESFKNPLKVYDGEGTSYALAQAPKPLLSVYFYRVKAKGTLGISLDSAWSKPVKPRFLANPLFTYPFRFPPKDLSDN
jgi:hypothetical protein